MMAFQLISSGVILCMVHVATSLPVGGALTLQDLEVADDTHSVGSYIREVRAAPPDYYRAYENDGDGEVGYSRKKQGGGKKGYQHFDSYHKKAGDNYEFEKADSYGDEHDGQKGAHSHTHEKKEKLTQRPADVEVEEEDSEGGSSSEDHSELKEGEADGNGGKESYGHDKADYTLPANYSYGEGDEYNF